MFLKEMSTNIEYPSIRASIRVRAIPAHDKKLAQDFLDE
jgi:hypothetical protein